MNEKTKQKRSGGFLFKKLKENMQMQNAKKGQDMLVHNTLLLRDRKRKRRRPVRVNLR